MERLRIGEILVAENALSEYAVARALGYQHASAEKFRLGTILLSWELLREQVLLDALSKLHRCPSVAWNELSKADREALRILPPSFAMRLGALPYAFDSGGLRVAFKDPSDLAALDEISNVTGKRLLPAVTTEVRLALAYQTFYGRPMPHPIRQILQKLDREEPAPQAPGAEPALAVAPGPVSRFLLPDGGCE